MYPIFHILEIADMVCDLRYDLQKYAIKSAILEF